MIHNKTLFSIRMTNISAGNAIKWRPVGGIFALGPRQGGKATRAPPSDRMGPIRLCVRSSLGKSFVFNWFEISIRSANLAGSSMDFVSDRGGQREFIHWQPYSTDHGRIRAIHQAACPRWLNQSIDWIYTDAGLAGLLRHRDFEEQLLGLISSGKG